MTTDTEKLKKRIELMSKELAFHQCKLRRHTRKKEIKLNEKKPKFIQNSSCLTTDTTDKFPCNLETSSVKVSSLSDHHFNCFSDSKDEAVGVSLGATLPRSEPEIIQNNVGRQVGVTAVPELALQQYFPVLGEENSSLRQTDIANQDIGLTMGANCTEDSTYSTPKKSISSGSNSNWSPILTQKNCVTRNYAKPQNKCIEKRKACLLSSTKLKRKYIHNKQTSLTLNPDMLCKTENTLPEDGLAVPNDIAHSENATAAHSDDTAAVCNEPERNALVTFPLCGVSDRVLSAISEDRFLFLVQELQISLWRIFESKAPQWSHIGALPRRLLDCGVSVGCLGRKVNFGSQEMFVCIELWASDSEAQTILTCVIYSYSTDEATLKCWCFELKRMQRYVKNVQFCILLDLSIVISWAHRDDALGTKIIKLNVDDELQSVLKSTRMVPATGPIRSLLSLKGCGAVITGESVSQIYLWNHCTGALIKIIQCLKPDMKLRWADEDQGFLFAAVSTQMHIELIAVNLITGKQKGVRKYLLPDTQKCLTGISVECGKMTAVFLEGFVSWDLAAETGTNTQTDIQQ